MKENLGLDELVFKALTELTKENESKKWFTFEEIKERIEKYLNSKE